MRFFVFLLLFTTLVYGQEVVLNDSSGLFEHTYIKNIENPQVLNQEVLYNNLQKLNYKSISKTDNTLRATSYFTKNIMGSALEVHYNIFIEFKKDRYRFSINSFSINDVRFGSSQLETKRKGVRKKWIRLINEKLPGILRNIEATDDW